MKDEGILVGRPAQGKHVYNWAVIPKNSVIDVLETELPSSIYPHMHIINSRRSRKIMKHLHLVEFVRRDVPSVNRGYITYADIVNIKTSIPVEEIITKGTQSLKSIDDLTEEFVFEEEIQVDEKFILDLTNTLGTGAKLPRRFYSTQVAFIMESKDGNKIGLMLPLQEMFVYIQDNPEQIKRLIVLPQYHFGIIVLDPEEPIHEDIFKSEVLDQISQSLTAFDVLLNKVNIQVTQED